MVEESNADGSLAEVADSIIDKLMADADGLAKLLLDSLAERDVLLAKISELQQASSAAEAKFRIAQRHAETEKRKAQSAKDRLNQFASLLVMEIRERRQLRAELSAAQASLAKCQIDAAQK